MTDSPQGPGLNLTVEEAMTVAHACSQVPVNAAMHDAPQSVEELYALLEPLLTSVEHIRMAALTFAEVIAYGRPLCSCGHRHPGALRFLRPGADGGVVEVPVDEVAEPERSAGRFITAAVGGDYVVAFAVLRTVPAEELTAFNHYLLNAAIHSARLAMSNAAQTDAAMRAWLTRGFGTDGQQ